MAKKRVKVSGKAPKKRLPPELRRTNQVGAGRHKPKKGKGAYSRKSKHSSRNYTHNSTAFLM